MNFRIFTSIFIDKRLFDTYSFLTRGGVLNLKCSEETRHLFLVLVCFGAFILSIAIIRLNVLGPLSTGLDVKAIDCISLNGYF